MTIHLEVLSEAQQAVLAPLASFANSQGFYLGGGTGVALHLGHRRSLDFDWFRPTEIADPFVLAQQVRDAGLTVEDVQVFPGTLHATISGVRASFLEYKYPLLSPLISVAEPCLDLASLDDLGAMKLAAVAQRGSRRDFLDLYALIRQHRPLDELLELYQTKYSTRDIAPVLIGITYFDDAEEEPSPMLLSDAPWGEVKRRFRHWARALSR